MLFASFEGGVCAEVDRIGLHRLRSAFFDVDQVQHAVLAITGVQQAGRSVDGCDLVEELGSRYIDDLAGLGLGGVGHAAQVDFPDGKGAFDAGEQGRAGEVSEDGVVEIGLELGDTKDGDVLREGGDGSTGLLLARVDLVYRWWGVQANDIHEELTIRTRNEVDWGSPRWEVVDG